MIAETLTYAQYRNLKSGTIALNPGINILYGDNAQGKTNFLEAVWLFTGAKSFRAAKDREMVAFGGDRASLTLDFNAQGRRQQAAIMIEKRRSAQLNGIGLRSAARLAGIFCAVVFSPAHLSLIKDGPEARRRFIDAAYCQLRPAYIRILAEYQRTLQQRNALLKEAARGQPLADDVLSVWDERLAQAGAAVYTARRAYVRMLETQTAGIYDGLSAQRETLSLAYESCVGSELPTGEEAQKKLFYLLQERHAADRAAGFTTAGIHRDDLALSIDGRAARIYGSQGQQRSAVLALKLAEAALLEQETGEQPVMLLDDVMSELDPARQDYILNHIHGWQVLITCCDPAPIQRLVQGAAFEVRDGIITRKDDGDGRAVL